MRPRLLSTALSTYVMHEWSGVNESGFAPLNTIVLVLPDTVPAESAGGIELIEGYRDRMEQAAETGTIVALGDAAFKFSFDHIHLWEGRKPSPGDRVLFTRYAGQIAKGDDGLNYRLMEFKDIGAMWDRERESVVRAIARNKEGVTGD